MGTRWENTALSTEFACNFCPGISPLQLSIVLVTIFVLAGLSRHSFVELKILGKWYKGKIYSTKQLLGKNKKSTFYPKHHVSKIVHTIVCVVPSFVNLKRTNSLCLQYQKMTPSTQKKTTTKNLKKIKITSTTPSCSGNRRLQTNRTFHTLDK